MGRTVKDPNRRQPKPVQKVQLSEKNVGRRIVLVVLFWRSDPVFWCMVL